MRERYKILSASPLVFKVLAWGSVVLSIISAGVILFGVEDVNTPKWAGGVILLAGALNFFILFVIAEGISLFLEMNEKIEPKS